MFHSDREKYYKKPLTDCLWLTALPTCGLVLYSSTIRTTVLGVKEWRWTIKYRRNSPDSPHTGGTLPRRLEKQKEEGVCRFSFRKFGGQLLCVWQHTIMGMGVCCPRRIQLQKELISYELITRVVWPTSPVTTAMQRAKTQLRNCIGKSSFPSQQWLQLGHQKTPWWSGKWNRKHRKNAFPKRCLLLALK